MIALCEGLHQRLRDREWYTRPGGERWNFWKNLHMFARTEEEKLSKRKPAGYAIPDRIYAILRAILYYVSPYHVWMIFQTAESETLIDLWAVIERVLMTAQKDSSPPEYQYFAHRGCSGFGDPIPRTGA